MSQNTLKVHDLNEDAEFDENGVEAFDEKALRKRNPVITTSLKKSCYRKATQRVLTRLSFTLVRLGIHHC